MTGKTIYILERTEPGSDYTAQLGWSFDKAELEDIIPKLKAKPECPYDEETRALVDDATHEWDLIKDEMWREAEKHNPHYDENRVPHIIDTKAYFAFNAKVGEEIVRLRNDWFTRNYPDLTTPEQLAAYAEFLEREYENYEYFVSELNHI